MSAQSMETAPLDGTRVLIKKQVYLYHQADRNSPRSGYRRHGTQWVECFFCDGKWERWCGKKETRSTDNVEALAWAPVPEKIDSQSECSTAYTEAIEVSNDLGFAGMSAADVIRYQAQEAADLKALLLSLHGWLVCECIAPPEDMALSFTPFREEIEALLKLEEV